MRNIKNITILILVIIFSFIFTSCDSPPILVETYDSIVTIEGINDPQHVEHFTLMTNSNETIIEDNFSPENVHNNTLTYEITGLEDNTDVSLVIDNQKIEGLEYEDSYQKTITQTKPDITIDLNQITTMYQVNFPDPENNDGLLTAKINDERIKSGDLVAKGSDIKFFVSPDGEDNEYFEVVNWNVNGEPVVPKVQKTTFLYENIQEDINVGVDLVKISYFKIILNKEDINVNLEEEISVNISCKAENISDMTGTQDIIFYVDNNIIDIKEVINLESGDYKELIFNNW